MHTPTPWEVNTLTGRPDGEVFSGNVLICDCQGTNVVMELEEIEANAAFIVQAVNAHAKLVESLKDCVQWLTAAMQATGNREIAQETERYQAYMSALKEAGCA